MMISETGLTKLITLISVTCFALMGCDKPVRSKDQIKSIEIATAGGRRGNPVIGIQIDSSLTFKYHGGNNAKLHGYYAGVVTQAFWDTLNIKLKQINFKKLDTAQYYGMDGEVAEVIFYWGNHKRHIFKPIDGDPDAVSNTFKWIANSYKQVVLRPLKDSFKFETTFQNILPPKVTKYQVKFPPPKKIRN